MSILGSLHLPRPKRFLYFLPLPLGTTIVAYTLLINKISGLYGLLALLAGASLSLPQLLMYIYSIILAFLLATWLIPGIADKKPAEAVVFTWVFGLDSLINAAFTGLFGAGWYLNGPGAQLYAHPVNSAGTSGIGFAGNETTVSVGEGQIPVGEAGATDQATTPGALPAESVASITIIALLWLIRVYFFLVVLAFSRAVVSGDDMENSGSGGRYSGIRSPALRGVGAIEAEPGWKGKIGRALVGVNRGYWEEIGGKGVYGGEWMRLGDAEERGRVRRAGGGSRATSSAGSSRSQSLRRD